MSKNLNSWKAILNKMASSKPLETPLSPPQAASPINNNSNTIITNANTTATAATLSPQSQTAPSPNHLSALKAAMVMGPTPKLTQSTELNQQHIQNDESSVTTINNNNSQPTQSHQPRPGSGSASGPGPSSTLSSSSVRTTTTTVPRTGSVTTTTTGGGTTTTTITITTKSISLSGAPTSTSTTSTSSTSTTATGVAGAGNTGASPKYNGSSSKEVGRPTTPKHNVNTNNSSNLMDIRGIVKPNSRPMPPSGNSEKTPAVAIDSLLAGISAIRQETIESSDKIGFSTSIEAMGKDVSALLGRDDLNGDHTSLALLDATTRSPATPKPSRGPTTAVSSSVGSAGSAGVGSTAVGAVGSRSVLSGGVRTQTPNANQTSHGIDKEKPGPPSTAHDFGGSRATPKTQKSSRFGVNASRVASASHAHKVPTTASAKSFVETRSDGRKSVAAVSGAGSGSPLDSRVGGTSKITNNTKGEVPLRTSKSLNRPTSSLGTKSGGLSSNLSNNQSLKLKPTKSFSTFRANHFKMGDAAAGDGAVTATATVTTTTTTTASSETKATLKEQFAAYSRFGDTSSDGKHISLTNSDKWMKQAHVIDGKKITTTDTSILFKKLFKTAKKVNFEDFKKYIEDLATSKKIEPQELQDKLINCGPPGLSSATRAAHAGVVERLTDTSKYTGSHKERFDSSGRGRGIEGRRDVKDGSGYTAAFKTKIAGDKNGGSGSTSPVPPSK